LIAVYDDYDDDVTDVATYGTMVDYAQLKHQETIDSILVNTVNRSNTNKFDICRDDCGADGGDDT
jgi:hypothetical protein